MPPVPTSRETAPSGNVSADGRRMDPRPCPRHPQSQFVKSLPESRAAPAGARRQRRCGRDNARAHEARLQRRREAADREEGRRLPRQRRARRPRGDAARGRHLQLRCCRRGAAQLGAQGAAGLEPRKVGRKPKLDAKDRRNAELLKRNAVLERKLHIAEAIIELQKKAHEILGIALPVTRRRDADGPRGRSRRSHRADRDGVPGAGRQPRDAVSEHATGAASHASRHGRPAHAA